MLDKTESSRSTDDHSTLWAYLEVPATQESKVRLGVTVHTTGSTLAGRGLLTQGAAGFDGPRWTISDSAEADSAM